MGEVFRLTTFVFICTLLLNAAFSQTVQKMIVHSDIRFRYATTEVTCVTSNDQKTARELLFDVTLPKDAFISNFTMEIEGQQYPGQVKEKTQAREQYNSALRTGSSGGIIEQSARHSNNFDVSVNIAAGSSVTFRLVYEELLRRRFGVYENAVYINPKAANILDYTLEVYIQERNAILSVRIPEMRKDIITNAVEELTNSFAEVSYPTASSAHVVYHPSAETLKQKGEGWFVVQYDVNSTAAGDLLVVDGYFVHFFIPDDDLPPLPLDVVFVLDVSGSMSGRKIEQLRDAMLVILDNLREEDRFNILLFDSDVRQWKPQLLQATKSTIMEAKLYVKTIRDRGTTNIHMALEEGLAALRGSRDRLNRVPILFFLTDGEPTAGVTDLSQIHADIRRKNEGITSIYSLAFGTGADYQFLRKLSAQNKGFARKIYEASDATQQVSGLYREISTVVLRNLTIAYQPTSSNADNSNDDQDELVILESTILVHPTVFQKSDFCVIGRIGPKHHTLKPLANGDSNKTANNGPHNVSDWLSSGEIQLQVSGLGQKGQQIVIVTGDRLDQLTLKGDNPFWAVPRDLARMTERAWGFLTIRQLLEKKLGAEGDRALDKTILDLSLKYNFVTPLTSMVVTRPHDTSNPKPAVASFVSDHDVRAAVQQNGQSAFRVSQQRSAQSYANGLAFDVSGGAGGLVHYGNMLGKALIPSSPSRRAHHGVPKGKALIPYSPSRRAHHGVPKGKALIPSSPSRRAHHGVPKGMKSSSRKNSGRTHTVTVVSKSNMDSEAGLTMYNARQFLIGQTETPKTSAPGCAKNSSKPCIFTTTAHA